MPDHALLLLVLVVAVALIFDYVNGFHDTANAIATCVSTRAMSIKWAIIMAAGLNFLGAVISTKVAATIGKGIVDPASVTQMVILAGVVGAIIWNLITWYYGLPSSSSHAIIGGIMGSSIAHAGVSVLHWEGL
ncbi:MAG TPA: anion permease, partial [Bdellovibrionales bacterium]|nr:anion permease [Bdellovibrionales bacterium]